MSKDRLVVTLGKEASEFVHSVASEDGITHPEAIRRGLNLLSLYRGLQDGEKLVIQHKGGKIEQLRILWGLK